MFADTNRDCSSLDPQDAVDLAKLAHRVISTAMEALSAPEEEHKLHLSNLEDKMHMESLHLRRVEAATRLTSLDVGWATYPEL